jgi:putative acetyltransferase
VLIRREVEADGPVVRAIHVAAFDHPESAGAEPVEARLLDELRADGDVVPALSLVAVQDGAVVGHVVCSPASIGGADAQVLGLGPIGVVPHLQGRGVGTALMHAVLAAADALGRPAVVLLGSPEYYGRFGFEPAAIHGVLPSEPAWGPYFQMRRLSAWTPSLTGPFRYAAAFDRI